MFNLLNCKFHINRVLDYVSLSLLDVESVSVMIFVKLRVKLYELRTLSRLIGLQLEIILNFAMNKTYVTILRGTYILFKNLSTRTITG